MKKTVLAFVMAGTLVLGTVSAVFAQEASSEPASEKQEVSSEAEESATEAKKESIGRMLSGLFAEGGELAHLFAEDGELSTLLQEGGLVDSLISSDGPLGKYIPEGLDVKELVSGIGEQLADENSELYQTADEVIGMVTDEEGNLDLNAVGELAGQIFGGGQAGEEVSDEEILAAAEEYIKTRNAELLETGDVQCVTPTVVQEVFGEDGSVQVLGYFLQENFVLDGTDLNQVGGAGDSLLLTLKKNDEGAWEVVDAEMSEDGEAYTASLEAMCDKVGITSDDFFSAMVFAGLNNLNSLSELMAGMPDAEKIQYAGELLTREDLEARTSGLLEEILSQMFAGMEDTTEAVTDASTGESTEAVTDASTGESTEAVTDAMTN